MVNITLHAGRPRYGGVLPCSSSQKARGRSRIRGEVLGDVEITGIVVVVVDVLWAGAVGTGGLPDGSLERDATVRQGIAEIYVFQPVAALAMGVTPNVFSLYNSRREAS